MDEQHVIAQQPGVVEAADAAEFGPPGAVADVHAHADAEFAGELDVFWLTSMVDSSGPRSIALRVTSARRQREARGAHGGCRPGGWGSAEHPLVESIDGQPYAKIPRMPLACRRRWPDWCVRGCSGCAIRPGGW